MSQKELCAIKNQRTNLTEDLELFLWPFETWDRAPDKPKLMSLKVRQTFLVVLAISFGYIAIC